MATSPGLDCPRLRENIWQVTLDDPTAFVETPDGCFEVATPQALAFLRVRPHCTPHNSVAEIARRSGTATDDVAAMLAALRGIGVVGEGSGTVADRLARIVELWSGELARDFIGNALLVEGLPREVLVGWLLEMYHYVRDFPAAISVAADHAPVGPLQALLTRYAAEERGHEHFVLETLANLGLSRAEVVNSRPLVSTQLIGFLMRDLFATAPGAALLMAAMVEAQEVADEHIEEFQTAVEARYGLPPRALAPYFAHQAIDSQLGHQRLFADNPDCFDVRDETLLDRIVDGLHDLKHGFDLQALEIRRYYGASPGAYVPRQSMPMAAI
ncbi:iron-containing redox enzyme family protein [Sphingomonas sp.]|uniref:iron-containing redox enzyme family protein n=1 Tax=Sphingomonas sp. TaxID=28214 RepID=UPI002E33F8D7|nr:iron-containing redox enzyme family protein [Sphingomonas sp.]HEX4693574.1 iron-containing redox enzyme family protein [Sphingomonas sp.]